MYMHVCKYVRMYDVCWYVCTMHVFGAQRGQKRKSTTLKLELQMVVGHHACAGNGTWVQE